MHPGPLQVPVGVGLYKYTKDFVLATVTYTPSEVCLTEKALSLRTSPESEAEGVKIPAIMYQPSDVC